MGAGGTSCPERRVSAGQPVPECTAGLGKKGMPCRCGLIRDRLVRAPASLNVTELVAIFRGRRHDGRNLLDRAARPAVTLREESTELFHGINGIEIDGERVGAYPGARVQAAGPTCQIILLERFEKMGGFEGSPQFPRSTHDCASGDDAAALRTSPESSCGLQLSLENQSNSCAFGPFGGRGAFSFSHGNLLDPTKP